MRGSPTAPDEFVAGHSVKSVVPAQNFYVRVADSGKPHAHQPPTQSQLWKAFRDGDQFVAADREREHFGMRNSVERSGEGLDQQWLLLRKNRAQVQDKPVFLDSGDDGNAGGRAAETFF